MKEKYKGVIGAVVKDQCDLISVCDEKDVTKEDTDKWFKYLVKIEESIGIPSDKTHDGIGGSYRTFHDHLLLYLIPDEIMFQLQGLRLTGNVNEQLLAVDNFMANFRKRLGV